MPAIAGHLVLIASFLSKLRHCDTIERRVRLETTKGLSCKAMQAKSVQTKHPKRRVTEMCIETEQRPYQAGAPRDGILTAVYGDKQKEVNGVLPSFFVVIFHHSEHFWWFPGERGWVPPPSPVRDPPPMTPYPKIFLAFCAETHSPVSPPGLWHGTPPPRGRTWWGVRPRTHSPTPPRRGLLTQKKPGSSFGKDVQTSL